MESATTVFNVQSENRMNSPTRCASVSENLDLQSARRSVSVFKSYRKYRERWRLDVNSIINETDYRIAFADDSAVRRYLAQTGNHKVDRKLGPVESTELQPPFRTQERSHLKWKQPRTVRSPTQKTQSSTPPTNRFIPKKSSAK
jgi:hypothetical protein